MACVLYSAVTALARVENHCLALFLHGLAGWSFVILDSFPDPLSLGGGALVQVGGSGYETIVIQSCIIDPDLRNTILFPW